MKTKERKMWECCISWPNLCSRSFILLDHVIYCINKIATDCAEINPLLWKWFWWYCIAALTPFDFVVTGIDGARLQCCSKAKTSVCWEQCVQVCGDLEGRPFIWAFSSFRLNVLWKSKGVIKLALTEKTRVTRLYFWILCLAGF